MTPKIILSLGLSAAVLAAPAVQAANPVAPPGNRPTAFPTIVKDIEVIQGPNILFIDRVLDGSAFGMDGEVTVRMLKLANGQYLLSPQWMSAEARELNARMCADQGRLPPADERAIIMLEETVFVVRCEGKPRTKSAQPDDRAEARHDQPVRKN